MYVHLNYARNNETYGGIINLAMNDEWLRDNRVCFKANIGTLRDKMEPNRFFELMYIK